MAQTVTPLTPLRKSSTLLLADAPPMPSSVSSAARMVAPDGMSRVNVSLVRELTKSSVASATSSLKRSIIIGSAPAVIDSEGSIIRPRRMAIAILAFAIICTPSS